MQKPRNQVNFDERRAQRRFNISHSDQRQAFARDRDRILYSSAFHRLAGITQIVRAGEQDIFHTRQQHTYKVAQIGRRLAEYCLELAQETQCSLPVDPEVVEAACLAHDLGHPPFGHAAEKELDRIVQGLHLKDPDPTLFDTDGYEGNAQTFRILTKLAVRYDPEQCHGLDLTRATLCAVLKYPWLRDHGEKKKRKKWSAYASETPDFEWSRELNSGEEKSIEADLMDWADDIAYSVHDLEDFHRVGVIPWSAIKSQKQRESIVNGAVDNWFDAPHDASARMRAALDRINGTVGVFTAVIDETYNGSREQRFQIRNLTSIWIGRFVRSVRLTASGIQIDEEAADEVRLLKYFARHYVIGLPALAAQQFGQRKIVRELFEIFLDAGQHGNLKLLPTRLRYIWEDHHKDKPARLAADCVASLTENEAYQLHRRLTGIDGGSILDPIVR